MKNAEKREAILNGKEFYHESNPYASLKIQTTCDDSYYLTEEKQYFMNVAKIDGYGIRVYTYKLGRGLSFNIKWSEITLK